MPMRHGFVSFDFFWHTPTGSKDSKFINAIVPLTFPDTAGRQPALTSCKLLLTPRGTHHAQRCTCHALPADVPGGHFTFHISLGKRTIGRKEVGHGQEPNR